MLPIGHLLTFLIESVYACVPGERRMPTSPLCRPELMPSNIGIASSDSLQL
jgi:hypothetical protein